MAFELIYQIGDILLPVLACHYCCNLLRQPVVLEWFVYSGHSYCAECVERAATEYASKYENRGVEMLHCTQCNRDVPNDMLPNPTLEHIVTRYRTWSVTLSRAHRTLRAVHAGLQDADNIDEQIDLLKSESTSRTQSLSNGGSNPEHDSTALAAGGTSDNRVGEQ
ncbi:MAG: hypothetical protein MHM6MM_007806 [Cercozoa sp. M6MM]